MNRIAYGVIALGVAGPVLAGNPGPASLCYEIIGCVQDRKISPDDAEKLGCEQLYTVRNGIYASRGYCFKTGRGQEEFGNEGCTYTDQDQVPLNDYERANVRLIQSIEKRRGC
jgi:hypothetical protein